MLDKSGSLVEDTTEKILSLVLNEYAAGMQIPSETELGELLGVGRNTIREAIRSLVGRNILEIRRGSGTFVSDKQGVAKDPLGLQFIKNQHKVAEDIMQIRILLEPTIASLAAENATNEEIEKLEHLASLFEEKVRDKQNPVAEDIAFHQQIARCSKNVVMPKLIPVINEAIRIFTDIKDGQQIEITLETHRQIVEAIRNRKPTAAQDAMLLHLAYNRNKIEKRKK